MSGDGPSSGVYTATRVSFTVPMVVHDLWLFMILTLFSLWKFWTFLRNFLIPNLSMLPRRKLKLILFIFILLPAKPLNWHYPRLMFGLSALQYGVLSQAYISNLAAWNSTSNKDFGDIWWKLVQIENYFIVMIFEIQSQPFVSQHFTREHGREEVIKVYIAPGRQSLQPLRKM